MSNHIITPSPVKLISFAKLSQHHQDNDSRGEIRRSGLSVKMISPPFNVGDSQHNLKTAVNRYGREGLKNVKNPGMEVEETKTGGLKVNVLMGSVPAESNSNVQKTAPEWGQKFAEVNNCKVKWEMVN
ncbi:hypothetical protein NE897_04180 [Yersinia ruckeri]|uniref:hypothetical protein n=1 Tax=Yersinia ruckeri TaxID=29486 RepID=UPI0011AB1DFE|nr:hypothetical protein [Yersinia ruckeri]EKN3347758.1 hypothetical protein [Yersinia ruckeri]EKN3363042.1 hypothetical protein [Yersinia ruckeri]EKN4202781.1 hypothetical protein [Yersinia ruckeri]EKN4207413.1 hypothetical protein [Yersinia ruckeri]EKN4727196.1 hypothetical protein [Yersinia ruckeri]